MSGRGLSFSGGTIDKLESIPGYNAALDITRFKRQLGEVGVVVAGQTHELAPADGKLYALRDVTGTVPSLPLIASSIMAKKIAAGADVIVLDVKVGQGAFMKTLKEAEALAQIMVDIGTESGRKVSAVLSDMSQPLGQAVGNALEVVEAFSTLRGRGPDDFWEHCLAVSEQLLYLGSRASSPATARAMLVEAVESGRALDKALEWIAAQGGDTSVLGDPPSLKRAAIVQPIAAPRSGIVAQIDAQEVGLTAVDLGAGRAAKGDPVDHAVGIVLETKVGDRVEAGDILFTIHANDEAKSVAARERLLAAYQWSESEIAPLPLVYKTIE
jgi:pyrimidine-nucleoside phosphorylase